MTRGQGIGIVIEIGIGRCPPARVTYYRVQVATSSHVFHALPCRPRPSSINLRYWNEMRYAQTATRPASEARSLLLKHEGCWQIGSGVRPFGSQVLAGLRFLIDFLSGGEEEGGT